MLGEALTTFKFVLMFFWPCIMI